MPELKKATFTPQPVRQDILLPDAFPALPKSVRERFGKDADEFDESARRWWARTKRVLMDAHFEVAQPQNAIKEDTRNIRKEFVAGDAVLSASFTETIEIVVTDVDALALRTTNLEASIDTPTTGLLARVTNVESAYVDATEATASANSAITASIASSSAGTIGATIDTERTARATVDGYFSGKYSMNVSIAGPTINSGVLVVGRAYQITAAGGVFTEVGAAANTVGVRFVATETTPTWSGGAVRQLIATGMNVSSITGGDVNTNEISFQADRFTLQTATGTPVQLLDVTTTGFVFGTDLRSDNYTSLSYGWKLTRAGRFEAQQGNIAGFEIGPSLLYASSVGAWGTRWFTVNTDFGLTPYMEVGSESGSARLDAISVGGKKEGHDLWALDEGFGGGVLRLWTGSGGGSTVEMRGSDGSVRCGAVTAASVSAGSYNVSSSRRFKDNIRPIEDALATLLQLRGVRFDWNTKVLPGDIGFIAEEVDQVLPTLVGRDPNGVVIGLDYGRTTALLVEAVKELANRLDAIRV